MHLKRRPAGAPISDSSELIIYIQCDAVCDNMPDITYGSNRGYKRERSVARYYFTSSGYRSPHLGLNQPLGPTSVCGRDARLSGQYAPGPRDKVH